MTIKPPTVAVIGRDGLINTSLLTEQTQIEPKVVVDVDDSAGLCAELSGSDIQENRLVDPAGEMGNWGSAGEHAGDGGHDIASVEGVADGSRGAPGEFMGFAGTEAAPGPGEQAVVGADDETLGDLGDEDSAAGANARVYDGQVDGSGAEAVHGTFEGDRAAEDVLGRDVVGDVDQDGGGAMAEDSAFHGGDVGIG